jgi:hypothetical protein
VLRFGFETDESRLSDESINEQSNHSNQSDKKRQTHDNKDIRPFQGRGTMRMHGGGFFFFVYNEKKHVAFATCFWCLNGAGKRT